MQLAILDPKMFDLFKEPGMYAICFDLVTAELQAHYHTPSYNNAYGDIARCLREFGFERQQGSVYFGNAGVNGVTCVLATQELTRRFPWFAPSVSDIRMLRIEEDNDLQPAINAMAPPARARQAA